MIVLTRESRARQVLASVAFTLLLVACNGDPIISDPRGGGIRNQVGNCSMGSLNSAWVNARLHGTRTQPAKCPYQVDQVGQFIAFSADLFGPTSTTNASGGGQLNPIRSNLDGWVVVPGQFRYWRNDPNDPNGRTLQFTGSYIAAHYPAGGPGPYSHDSGTVQVDLTSYGQALAFLTLSGSALVSPGYLVLPGQVVAGVPAQFRAVTDVDTSAYNFNWRIDGVDVPGNNDARLNTTFASAGSHQVTAYATNASGGVQTMNSTVTAQLNIGFSGNTSGKTGASVTYSALISGGSAPYTYSWRLNGGTVGSGATYRYTFGSACTAHLSLSVTDGAGRTGSGAEDLYLIDPNC